MPKSMISASPSAPSMMLAGLRSRWTTPASCAATSPDTTERATRITVATWSFPSLLSSVARSMPSTNDIVMYLMPSISPRS